MHSIVYIEAVFFCCCCWQFVLLLSSGSNSNCDKSTVNTYIIDGKTVLNCFPYYSILLCKAMYMLAVRYSASVTLYSWSSTIRYISNCWYIPLSLYIYVVSQIVSYIYKYDITCTVNCSSQNCVSINEILDCNNNHRVLECMIAESQLL